MLWFKTCSNDHNKILHMSQQCYCRDMCKISSWSIQYVMYKNIINFRWISNSIEISLVGQAPASHWMPTFWILTFLFISTLSTSIKLILMFLCVALYLARRKLTFCHPGRAVHIFSLLPESAHCRTCSSKVLFVKTAFLTDRRPDHICHICVNKLGRHWFLEWLVACLAPSHYLGQCWLIVDYTLENKFQWN